MFIAGVMYLRHFTAMDILIVQGWQTTMKRSVVAQIARHGVPMLATAKLLAIAHAIMMEKKRSVHVTLHHVSPHHINRYFICKFFCDNQNSFAFYRTSIRNKKFAAATIIKVRLL